MPHTILHVISEDVEEEHIAANVQPTCMQEHRGDQRQIDRIRRLKGQIGRHSWERGLRDAMHDRRWYSRVREHKCLSVRAERYLIEKNGHVDDNQPPVYPRQGSAWSGIVFDMDHRLPPALVVVV